MRYNFLAVHNYRLDIHALAAAPVRIVLASSSEGRTPPVYRCTQALAEQLGTTVVEFPSHHTGYVCYPHVFAARLDQILRIEQAE
jgi:hypothetical protein